MFFKKIPLYTFTNDFGNEETAYQVAFDLHEIKPFFTMDDDKKIEVRNIAKCMYEVSELARKEGLLMLEDFFDNDENFKDIKLEYAKIFMKKLVGLVVDGTDFDILASIGKSYINNSLLFEYCWDDNDLKFVLSFILLGFLCVVVNQNPLVTAETFASCFGLKDGQTFLEQFSN